MTATTRDQWVYIAKIREHTERYEDMLEAMSKVIQDNAELSFEERNLLSVACKNTIGSKRTAWRAICTVQKKEEQKNSKYLELIRSEKVKIENELNKYCNAILTLVNEKLLQKATNAEEKVFFYKMKGDYYRYIAQYTTNAAQSILVEKSGQAYQTGTTIAEAELKSTNPIRLGLALNYSVYFYEIKKDVNVACQHVKKAFDCAIADIDEIREQHYKDVTTIMSLLSDNRTLWSYEIENQDN